MEQHDLYIAELKFASETSGEFTGVAVTFGTEIPHPLYGVDVIRPDAFARSLATKGPGGIKMLWQHDVSEPVGTWLSLREDRDGLKVHGRLLLELRKAQEAQVLMKNKVVDGLSIGFNIPPGGAQVDERKRTRIISEADLMEISPVTFPADVRARVMEMKSQQAMFATLLEQIRQLRRLVRSRR